MFHAASMFVYVCENVCMCVCMCVPGDDNPVDSDMKALSGVYQKILHVPRPDYGTRILLWVHALKQEGATVSPSLDLSSLAKISDGYTAGDIVACVRKVCVLVCLSSSLLYSAYMNEGLLLNVCL